MIKFDAFSFDFGKVMAFCSELQSTEAQLHYLRFVLVEFQNPGLNAVAEQSLGRLSGFEKKLKDEIEYRRRLVSETILPTAKPSEESGTIGHSKKKEPTSEQKSTLKDVPNYDFVFEKVMQHCDQIKTIKDQLYYLRGVNITHTAKVLHVKKTPRGYETTPEAFEFSTKLRAEIKRRQQIIDSEEDREDGETFAKVKRGELKDHPVFDFNYKRMVLYRDRFETSHEQLAYLIYVKKELNNFLAECDFYDRIPLEFPVDLFKEQLENEIEFLQTKGKMGLNTGDHRDTKDIKEPTAKAAKQRQMEKIQWQGSEAQVVYLFDLLFKEQFITQAQWETRFKTIADHFVNKNGQPFDNKQLAQTAQNIESNKNQKPKGAEKLEQITKTIKDK